MNARLERICLRGTLLAALIASVGCGGGTPGGAADPECALDSITDENEKSPGYPFDYAVYRSDIAPLLATTCTNGTCHAPDAAELNTNKNFVVYPAAATDECDGVKTFKEFRKHIDPTITVEGSKLVTVLTGGLAAHPVQTGNGTYVQADLDKLTAFITTAHDVCVEGGGCSDNNSNSVWNKQTFETVIQPGIDAAEAGGQATGCSSGAACHAPPNGQLNIVLHPNPEPGSPEMDENFAEVTAAIDYNQDPTQSLFYRQATTPHSPGELSSLVSAETAQALVDFTLAAKAIADEGGGGEQPEGCADPALLDVGVFENDILPILRGERDLNNQDDQGTATGCTRAVCHGRYKPASLSLDPAASIEEQLASFACYVSLTNPSNSMVLLCPSDSSQCQIADGHPGGRVLEGADDLNYQRILSYLFSVSNSLAVPVDFAFYARVIDPIFNDRQAVEAGAQGRTCADTSECHGVAVASTQPPNGSNYGIIPNAGNNQERLRANFVEAAAFINFQTPEGSSLFMYPTNEIANDDENPFATGVNHPGGEDFAVDSAFALNILKFAFGLRPDANGFQRNWLVAGGYAAQDIDDDTPIDEDNIQPLIFDDSNGDDLAERWDGLFEDVELVDLNAFIAGNVGNGRIAFATSYLLNQTTVEQDVEVVVNTNNDIRLYVGDSATTQEGGGEVRLEFSVPPARSTEDPGISRIFIKLFQAADQANLDFTAQLLRADVQGDVPFTDAGEEILVLLNNVGQI